MKCFFNAYFRYFQRWEEIDTYLGKTDFPSDFESTWEKVVTGAPIYYAHADKVKNEISCCHNLLSGPFARR